MEFALIARNDSRLRDAFPGCEDRDGHRAVVEVLRVGVLDDDDLRREVERLYAVARESLVAVWASVAAVAEALLEREELDRAGLDAAIGEADIQKLRPGAGEIFVEGPLPRDAATE